MLMLTVTMVVINNDVYEYSDHNNSNFYQK
jgi:hypothetical protein